MTEIVENKFSLGGYSNTTLNFHVLDGWKRPLAPGTEDRTANVLGRAGSIFIDSKLSTRTFNIPGYFIADSAADLDSCARTLAALLVDTDGKPQTLALVFTDEPTLTYTVRYNSAIDLDRFVDQMRGTFAIPLIADDPYAYEAEEVSSGIISTSPAELTLTSTGSVATPAIIKVANLGGGGGALSGFTIRISHSELI